MNLVRRNSPGDQKLSHTFADNHIRGGSFQRLVTSIGDHPAGNAAQQWNAQLDRDLRIDVLQPIHQQRALPSRHEGGRYGEQWRIGLRDNDVALSSQPPKQSECRPIKRQIVEQAADKPCPAKSGRCHAVDGDTVNDFLIRKAGTWIVINLAAGNNVYLTTATCQMKRKISEDLAGRGMIGIG